MNNLEPGAGGAIAPSPENNKANPLTVRSRARPASQMMQHFNSREDTAAKQFKLIKESKAQIDTIMEVFKGLTEMQDTVTTKDVVKGSAAIVAAGVPAVQMASILADMPDQGQQLQSWVKYEYDMAVKGDQQIIQALNHVRHEMITSSLNTLIAHSAESKLMAGPAQGNA